MTDKPLSRQRRWQIEQVANGRCCICAQPAQTKRNGNPSVYCKDHADKNRVLVRNRYRIKHGIPLDQPIWKRA